MAVSAFDLWGELKIGTRSFDNALRNSDAALMSTKKNIDAVENRSTLLGKTTAVAARSFEKMRDSVAGANARLKDTAIAFARGEATATQMKNAFKAVETATAQLNSRLRDTSARLADVKGKASTIGRDLKNAFGALGGGLQGGGGALTGALSLPLLGLGAAAIKAASDIDTLKVQLVAATGSTDAANKKFEELRKISLANAGVMTEGAVATYSLLKPMKLAESTLNDVVIAFGKLKAANPETDLRKTSQNILQLFGQNFEMQDLKEAINNFPRFGEVMKKAFNLKGEASNLKELQEALQELKANGLTLEQLFAGLAKGINTDATFALITDPIAVRFEKMVERIKIALLPLGETLIGVFARFTPTIIATIEKLSAAFIALGPQGQMVAVAIGAIAAVIGPVVVGMGILVASVTSIAGGIAAVAPLLPVIALAIAGITSAMAPLIAIGAIFYQGWVDNWDKVIDTFNVMAERAKNIYNAFMTEITAFWNEHGERITKYATAWYGTLSKLIDQAMGIVSEYVKLGLQVIQGDWDGAWQTVLQITQKVADALTTLIGNALKTTQDLFSALGPILGQIIGAILSKVATLVVKAAAFLLDVFLNLPSYLIALVPRFIAAGASIGEAIQRGIWQGLKNAAGIPTAEAGVGGSVAFSNPFNSMLESIKSLFGGGPQAAVEGGLGGTFLTPIKTEAIKTAAALDQVKKKIDTVKAAVTAPVSSAATTSSNTITATMRGFRDPRTGASYDNQIYSTDTKIDSPVEFDWERFLEAKVPNQKLEITLVGNGLASGVKSATPQAVIDRFVN